MKPWPAPSLEFLAESSDEVLQELLIRRASRAADIRKELKVLVEEMATQIAASEMAHAVLELRKRGDLRILCLQKSFTFIAGPVTDGLPVRKRTERSQGELREAAAD